MHLENVKRQAAAVMPKVDYLTKKGTYRHNVIDSLNSHGNVGIELGVASGIFSSRMVNSGRFSLFFGVDVYGDIHNTNQYKDALRRVGLMAPYKLLRMTFDEAYDLFDDETFDFIYADGYAHTGEEGGQTLIKWYRKLKVGGVMAGDDYHSDWPLVQWAVNDFVQQLGVELMVTDLTEENPYCSYPSWYFIKPETSPADLKVDPNLLQLGRSEKERIHQLRGKKTEGALYSMAVKLLQYVGLKETVKRLMGR